MSEHQKPEGCMCMGNCAKCKCGRNTSSTDDKKDASTKPYFGDSPDDLEATTTEFIDKHFK